MDVKNRRLSIFEGLKYYTPVAFTSMVATRLLLSVLFIVWLVNKKCLIFGLFCVWSITYVIFE